MIVFSIEQLDESSVQLPTIPDVVATGPERKEELDFVDKSSLSSGNPSVSSIRIVSSMDKTPSGERDDHELCISEELNVTDDDDKGCIIISLLHTPNSITKIHLPFFFQ